MKRLSWSNHCGYALCCVSVGNTVYIIIFNLNKSCGGSGHLQSEDLEAEKDCKSQASFSYTVKLCLKNKNKLYTLRKIFKLVILSIFDNKLLSFLS